MPTTGRAMSTHILSLDVSNGSAIATCNDSIRILHTCILGDMNCLSTVKVVDLIHQLVEPCDCLNPFRIFLDSKHSGLCLRHTCYKSGEYCGILQFSFMG